MNTQTQAPVMEVYLRAPYIYQVVPTDACFTTVSFAIDTDILLVNNFVKESTENGGLS